MERKLRGQQDESEILANNYTNGRKVTGFRGADQKSGRVLPVSMEGFYEDIDPAIFDELIRKGDLPRLYLTESGGHPLLTKEEEYENAIAWHEAREYMKLVPHVEDEYEKERYAEIIRRGVLARQKLVECNIRLVVTIASKYRENGVDFNDLIQGGNIGLLKAIDKFDTKLGNKFSTYATWWITQGIWKEITERGRTIRLPSNISYLLRRIKKEYNSFAQELQREPNSHEFADYVGMTRQEVDALLALAAPISSIHEPIGVDSETNLEDVVPDPDSGVESPEFKEELRRKKIDDAFQILKKRESDILFLRFGLKDGVSLTLEEIGRRYGLTRERIRQIEKKALDKLKQDPTTALLLQDLLDI